MKKQINKVVCPKCGYEYTPSEIFYPEDILPDVGEVVRKEDGTIDFCTGKSDLEVEEFTCDHCGCIFKATPELAVSTSIENTVESFDDDYSTPIFKDRITLDEPEK